MITGRNPWKVACTLEDSAFAAYLHDPEDYLRRTLPMSPAARAVLLRILTFDPINRISLPDLRDMILAVDTFFLSEKDEVVFELKRQLTKQGSIDIADAGRGSASGGSKLEPIEIHSLPTPPDPQSDEDASVKAIFAMSQATVSHVTHDSLFSAPSVYSSESESAESAGPTTPEQRALVEASPVPVLRLGSSNVRTDEIAIPVEKECDITETGIGEPQCALRKRKVAQSWDRFIGAVQKIRVLAQ